MPTRTGKIANLPNNLREQLNLRLLDGETGRDLAVWLNALPEVQSILGSHFNGAPISEVNLTHWRQGGYIQWLTERECFDTARALAEGDGDLASAGLSAERLLNVLTVRFGQLLMSWDTSTDENISESAAFAQIAKKARILQGISRSVLAIHRIQSQSALQKTDSATSRSDTNPSRAEAAKRVGGSHAMPEPIAVPIPQSGGSYSKAKETGELRENRASLPQATGQPANATGTPHNGTIFSKTDRSAQPKILSGPIPPSNLSHTSFKPDHNLEEILKAV